MKICQQCGAQNASDAVFCCGCGARMDSFVSATPYSQPGFVPAGGARRPVQTDRSLFLYIFLTIVTCGIYSWIFIYKLAKDTNEICFDDGETTPGLGAMILYSILTCGFYSFYWMYKIQNRYQVAGMKYGVPVVENGTSLLMWYLCGSLFCGLGHYVAMHIVITTANKLAVAHNAKYCR